MAKAVGMILAAGLATRLRPLSTLRPKALMEIGGQNILSILIRMLENAGVEDIFVNIHYEAAQVQRALLEIPCKASIHLSHEEEILGTGGGLCRVIQKFGLKDQKLVLLHGDILCDVDLEPLLKTDDYCTLIGARGRSVDGYEGGLATDSEGTIIELGRFFSCPGQKHEQGFFTGIHILSKEAVEDLKTEQAFSLVADIYPQWLKKGRILKAHMLDLDYEDLGTPQRIYEANMALFDPKRLFSHVHLSPPEQHRDIYVDNTTKLGAEVIIKGPVYIFKNAIIEDGARIGPRVIIGEGAHIKSGAVIKNSVVMSKSVIEKDERLDCAVALLDARVLGT